MKESVRGEGACGPLTAVKPLSVAIAVPMLPSDGMTCHWLGSYRFVMPSLLPLTDVLPFSSDSEIGMIQKS